MRRFFNWLGKLLEGKIVRRQLPQAEQEDCYVPPDPQDQAVLAGMQNLTVGGRIQLPSGFKLERPPEGFIWRVEGNSIRLAKVESAVVGRNFTA
jgi:hypothetical protein